VNVRNLMRSAPRDAVEFWLDRIPRARLDIFARAFAFSFLLYLVGWSMHAREWLTSYGYHVTTATIGRAYPSPAPLVPESILVPVVALMWFCALHASLRPRSCIAQGMALAVAVYIQLVDQTSSFTLNKIFIVGFAVLFAATLASSTERGAVDERFSAWPVRTLQATILMQYFTAGTCKVFFGDWLRRSDILYTHTVGVYRTDVAGFVVEHAPAFAWTLLAIGALSFELFAPVLFMWRRTRLIGAIAGVLFHGSIALLMKDLVFFSAQMVTFYLLFVDDERALAFETSCARRWRHTHGTV